MDLAFDRLDVEDGWKVEAAPPDEGGQGLQEIAPGTNIAQHGARLDEGRPLPVLADALIIGQGEGHGHDRRSRGRIGPQPQVDAEHIAVAGPLLHQGRQGLGGAVEEFLRLDTLGERTFQRLGLPEQADVDVGRIVQLEGAVLAHGQAKQSGDRATRIVGA